VSRGLSVLPLILLAIVFVPMLAEARLSTSNERALRAAGATEPAGDVYRLMKIAYPLCFLLPIGEAWLRERSWTAGAIAVAGAAVFAASKILKYWAIASLGQRWTFRVLVPPASSLTATGPYRFIRHPNYVAVAGEIVGVSLMAGAPVTGPLAVALFGGLMLRRIRVEERAIGPRRG
jgi:methyltransferase